MNANRKFPISPNRPIPRSPFAFIRVHSRLSISLVVLCLLPSGCDRSSSAGGTSPVSSPAATAATAAAAPTPVYPYEIVREYPHDIRAFTEGLVFVDGQLYESTGLNNTSTPIGQSTLRRVDLLTGKIEQRLNLPVEYFGEGLATFGGKLYQLTWRHEKGFVYDLKTFKLEREFHYQGEGWGLASDGKVLLMSDGSDLIRFLDPETLEVKRSIHVTEQGRAVANLNELEYVNGDLLANVWKTTLVAGIDPLTGQVRYWADFRGVLNALDQSGYVDVMNGIAYDARGDRLFVTGKFWSKLFEVRIKK